MKRTYNCVVALGVSSHHTHLAHAPAIRINGNVNVLGHVLGRPDWLQEESLNIRLLKA